MTNERMERRLYRRSPGRQYSQEDYEDLRSQSYRGQTEQTRWPSASSSRTPSGSLLTRRPDLRRTRQLMRQSILASKREEMSLHSEGVLTAPPETEEELLPSVRDRSHTLYSRELYATAGPRSPRLPSRRQLPEEEEAEEWSDEAIALVEDEAEQYGFAPPEFEESYNQERYGRPMAAAGRYENELLEDEEEGSAFSNSEPLPPVRRRATRHLATRRLAEPEPEEFLPPEEEEYYEEEKPRRKKRILTRRRVLVGLGVAATGGAVVAASQLAPKIPETIGNTASNIERQVADAFNRGFQAGADSVRKELISSLENIEGVSLDAAIAAARLLRTAYNVFVSPLLTLAANVTGDFLNVTLRAFKQARQWLANIGQDNQVLAALQTVLESWSTQVKQMPKQLQAITDADLDGAQTYLRGVQRTLAEEKAKLNAGSQQATPSPSPTASTKKS
ncbi:MAG: hypothetical protein IMW90_07940 [Thermogemmatispora sp.]|uniref:Uncharacterized protein n=1 Tax=Thermogemmatispora aurantia TaxID=2045279 RepID=A0A5J4KGY8_9CHLR|nr:MULTISPECIES: hypothetical protein [Thermogemmatispora]MBE3565647.1 hypothetical protein [Thermogemmatispora sp.]GER85707.1 hypothetical protein KTAU_43410 [Thermogemmatispora aurantia]